MRSDRCPAPMDDDAQRQTLVLVFFSFVCLFGGWGKGGGCSLVFWNLHFIPHSRSMSSASTRLNFSERQLSSKMSVWSRESYGLYFFLPTNVHETRQKANRNGIAYTIVEFAKLFFRSSVANVIPSWVLMYANTFNVWTQFPMRGKMHEIMQRKLSHALTIRQ